MIETFVALLFAHVMADYVFQSGWMVARKRNPMVLLLHLFIVLALSLAVTGHLDTKAVWAVALAHGAIDAVKTWGFRDTLAAHLADQALHLVTIAGAAAYVPDLWSTGQWAAAPTWVPHLMTVLAGMLVATRTGGFAVGKLMAPLESEIEDSGLTNGGLLIGLLERGLIFIFILSDQAASVAFLIAAKSLYSFGSKNKHAQYVIIGTLASFGWAILAAQATVTLLNLLPPLEIGARIP